METEATCSVCLDLFDTPIILPCGHNFCKKCIEGIVEVHSNNDNDDSDDEFPSSSLKCPQCRHFVDLSSKGLDSFQVNKPLQNISVLLKEKNRALGRSLSWKDVCAKHQAEEQSFYCQTCNSTVCPQCAKIDHSGFGHVVNDLEEYVTGEKTKMDTVMEDMKKIKNEIAAKKLYLQEIVDDAKACEKECNGRIADEIQQLVQQLQRRKTDFTSQVTSKCREVYGPIETMISVYRSLEAEANCLEQEYNSLNYGDPIRRIKKYQNLSVRANSFVTFRMRSVPALPTPPEKLSRVMVGGLSDVYIATNRVFLQRFMSDSTTQTDLTEEGKKLAKQPSFNKRSVDGDAKAEEQNASQEASRMHNNIKQPNKDVHIEDLFGKGSKSFNSVPTFDECASASSWRGAAYQFASGSTLNEALTHQFQNFNPAPITSNQSMFGKKEKEITLQRFTDKLARGTSFHESLPSSPNFAFGGKKDENVFVFHAHGDEHKADDAETGNASPSAAGAGKAEGVTRQASMAVNARLSLVDKEQKSSSTPNLVFGATAGETSVARNWTNDEQKWQLPKPAYWGNNERSSSLAPRSSSRRAASRSPRRHRTRITSPSPWSCTPLGAMGGSFKGAFGAPSPLTINNNGQNNNDADNASPMSDEDLSSGISKKRFNFNFSANNEASTSSGNAEASDTGVGPSSQRKRTVDWNDLEQEESQENNENSDE